MGEHLRRIPGGGIGSGKSRLTPIWTQLLAPAECDSVHIDVFDIRTKLQEWETEIKAEKVQCAAHKLFQPALRIAQKCFDYMIAHKYNVVYERNMADYGETYFRVLKAQKAGYNVGVFGATVDIPEAAKRSMISANESKQYVPLCVIVNSHVKFSENFRTYMAIMPINELYDTSTKDPILIVTDNRVVDAGRFQTFLDKSSQTMQTVMSQMDPALREQYEYLHNQCNLCKEESVTVTEKDNQICNDVFRQARTCAKPIAAFVAAGTGDGTKTVVPYEDIFRTNNCGYGRIDVDEFMERMSDWEKVTIGKGNVEAMKFTDERMSWLSTALDEHCWRRRMWFTLEHTPS